MGESEKNSLRILHNKFLIEFEEERWERLLLPRIWNKPPWHLRKSHTFIINLVGAKPIFMPSGNKRNVYFSLFNAFYYESTRRCVSSWYDMKGNGVNCVS